MKKISEPIAVLFPALPSKRQRLNMQFGRFAICWRLSAIQTNYQNEEHRFSPAKVFSSAARGVMITY